MFQDIAKYMLELRSAPIPPDFSGFGVVLYRGDIRMLPLAPLVKDIVAANPTSDTAAALNFLFSISRYSDPKHDGFHFIHEESGISRIAQFFSPPIPISYVPKNFGVGARYRAGEFGSLIHNVISINIFNRDGTVVEFRNGAEIKYAR